MKNALPSVALISVLIAGLSCAQYTAADFLPLAPGQVWHMRDQFGRKTRFEILARSSPQGCQEGDFLDMYITKGETDAYWAPGGLPFGLRF